MCDLAVKIQGTNLSEKKFSKIYIQKKEKKRDSFCAKCSISLGLLLSNDFE